MSSFWVITSDGSHRQGGHPGRRRCCRSFQTWIPAGHRTGGRSSCTPGDAASSTTTPTSRRRGSSRRRLSGHHSKNSSREGPQDGQAPVVVNIRRPVCLRPTLVGGARPTSTSSWWPTPMARTSIRRIPGTSHSRRPVGRPMTGSSVSPASAPISTCHGRSRSPRRLRASRDPRACPGRSAVRASRNGSRLKAVLVKLICRSCSLDQPFPHSPSLVRAAQNHEALGGHRHDRAPQDH